VWSRHVLPDQKIWRPRHLHAVENHRDGSAVRQSVIANLGRADALMASGAFASLPAPSSAIR
jgi:hypothetical protein